LFFGRGKDKVFFLFIARKNRKNKKITAEYKTAKVLTIVKRLKIKTGNAKKDVNIICKSTVQVIIFFSISKEMDNFATKL
jgi:hypothetical protein